MLTEVSEDNEKTYSSHGVSFSTNLGEIVFNVPLQTMKKRDEGWLEFLIEAFRRNEVVHINMNEEERRFLMDSNWTYEDDDFVEFLKLF